MSSGPTNPAPPRACLLVLRPQASGTAHGGDEVMYRKAFQYLALSYELDVVELPPVGKLAKYVNMARGMPPECTRLYSAANLQMVAERAKSGNYDAALLFNEASFPMLSSVKQGGIPAVLISQNVHSLVAETDPGLVARALRPLALHYERHYYADPYARLLEISQADVDALRRAGIRADDLPISPPGAPPAVALREDAGLIAEAVVTGSYGWWRKRRDLTAFAKGGTIGVPIYAADPQARTILGEQAGVLEDTPEFWSQGLRFGLVTDAFVGGFKLKSLEYVAKNCVVLSLADIGMEFAGIPHAEEFVRLVPDVAAVRSAIESIRASEPAALLERFRVFKAECLERYDWDRCLAPLGEVVAEALN